MTAIVVDDDMPTVDVIVSHTDWKKFRIDEVYSCYNITSAKEYFRKERIDIAVCDIEMPMGSGLDLLQWAREQGYDTQFIFLTSHERFDYASTAIRYNASGYVVKPFNEERMEQELSSAAQKVHHEEEYQKAVRYEDWFSRTSAFVEQSFWSDLFLQHIIARKEIIEGEITRRKVAIDPEKTYRFVLFSSGYVDEIEKQWGEGESGIYEYALSKAAAEILEDSLTAERVFNYHEKNGIYTIAVLPGGEDTEQIRSGCERVTQTASHFLKTMVTGYISNSYPLWSLASARDHLEQLDSNNVAAKGKIFLEDDEIVLDREQGHILDQEQVRALLGEKKKRELLNLLKYSMERLAAKKMLDQASLQEIRQDLLQAVYVYLFGKQIQATELFGDSVSASMEEKAAGSLMDMIRWQTYVITKTIDYVDEVEQSGSIIERAKAFIREHYREDITRVEVAKSVYLTPEYMARIFKKETGESLKQYITDVRIARAKELLSSRDARISDVAAQVGFDNFSYFSTVFKKTTGMTPVEYHNSMIQN